MEFSTRGKTYHSDFRILLWVYESPVKIDALSLIGDEPDLDPVILYIHANYHRKINISDLTREFHINRTSLLERFTKTTGMSFLNYLNTLRVRIALILRNTELPIAEVMDKVGFTDRTHFGRIFRRYAGCSPSDYRQSAKWR